MKAAAEDTLYGDSLHNAQRLASKSHAPPLKKKLGELFHWGAGHHDSQSPKTSNDNDFQPMPAKTSGKRKGKGKAGKAPTTKLRKVKEVQLKVVGLAKPSLRTPTGAERERASREVWVRVSGTQREIEESIREAFNWDHDSQLHYMYAQGRNLRSARLEDIE